MYIYTMYIHTCTCVYILYSICTCTYTVFCMYMYMYMCVNVHILYSLCTCVNIHAMYDFLILSLVIVLLMVVIHVPRKKQYCLQHISVKYSLETTMRLNTNQDFSSE